MAAATRAKTGNQVKNGKVRRFGRWSIVCHWLYAACFLTLLVTGFGLMYDWLDFLAGAGSRLVHRYAAIGLAIMPLLYLVGSGREALSHIREAFRWSKDDLRWLAVAVPYHFTGRPKPPAQGFLNAGQKLNYLVVITTFVVFVTTGLIMWFLRPQLTVADQGVFWWAVMLHSAAAWVAASMFLLHVYQAALHPFTRASLRGMIDGYVTLEYALFEHPKWAQQFVGQSGSKPANR
ncbi:MAG: cytochrome b/b6 domain-containing protein [Firmicutes bacterium]|nr:cytochrome b/b6 domain-containing protein [Bacillota bacterium]